MIAIKGLLDSAGYCIVCGGEGFLDKDCPSCGKKAQKLSLDFEKITTKDFARKLGNLGVPKNYQGITWTKDTLMKTKPNDANNPIFQKFAGQLERFHSKFVSGDIPESSVFIIAKQGYSKHVLAFSCIQFAMQKGFTVAPLIDSLDLKRLVVLSADKPYKLFNEIEYDDYVMADVCFVEVTRLGQRAYASEILQELINKRARYGLATFVLSDFSLEEISRYDKTNSFAAYNNTGFVDGNKYPSCIKFL